MTNEFLTTAEAASKFSMPMAAGLIAAVSIAKRSHDDANDGIAFDDRSFNVSVSRTDHETAGNDRFTWDVDFITGNPSFMTHMIDHADDRAKLMMRMDTMQLVAWIFENWDRDHDDIEMTGGAFVQRDQIPLKSEMQPSSTVSVVQNPVLIHAAIANAGPDFGAEVVIGAGREVIADGVNISSNTSMTRYKGDPVSAYNAALCVVADGVVIKSGGKVVYWQ